MATDLDALKKALAEHKVYDAWKYVESLNETLGYMNISHEMLNAVYTHRLTTLQTVEQEIFQKAASEGRAALTVADMERTNLSIGGYPIDDIVFLKKTTMEFFHYARISMDILFQIINAALLGDIAFDVADKGLIGKLLSKLKTKTEFASLLAMMNTNKDDPKFQYLTAFDNYIKHIKTILITVSNSVFIGNKNVFMLDEFCYCGVFYPCVNAIDRIQELNDYVIQTIETILNEVLTQIPNCLDNSHRVHSIKFKQLFHKKDNGDYLQYMSFFVEVEDALADLPQEINVLPLIIKTNGDICTFDFRFDKIFIKKKDTSEYEVIGCADLKNGLETNEFYRTFEVKPCTPLDYMEYTRTFISTYEGKKITGNYHAMEGEVLFIEV